MTGAASLLARCPAKVNLSLRVLGRRADGYHELETVFQAIDLWDEIEATLAPTLSFTCDDPALPTDDSNLVVRAALRLRETLAAEHQVGAVLHLRKRIPSGGGLGGGSSDAAGALLLLSRLWEIPAERCTLSDLAAELGADVPFFLEGGTSRGTGRGDRIEPLPTLGPLPILLGCPPYGIETAEVYAALRTRLTPPAKGVSLRAFSAHQWPGENEFRFAVNDLEPVVFGMRPELAAFRDALRREGARLASLSGSGSTVFGVFADAARLQESVPALRTRFAGWRLIPTRAIPGAAHVVEWSGAAGSSRRGE